MSANAKIINSQLHLTNKIATLSLFNQAFVIVPYEPGGGYFDVSNKGVENGAQNPSNHETFKRLWTGNEAIILNWKDSLTANQDINEFLEDGITPNPNYLKIFNRYQLGEVFLGNVQTNDNENQINRDTSFDEYLSQQVKKIYHFRVDKFFKITEEYQFMFFKIPELEGSTLFRISNIERNFIGKNEDATVITFESVNQDLANTGTARQQNIMSHAPGQGFLECVVKDKDWIIPPGAVEGKDYYRLYERYIIGNFNGTINNPVRKAVVKAYGAGVFSSVSFEGRRVDINGNFEKFGIPRLIFPINLKPASTPNIYRSQSAEVNFYYGEFSPSILFTKELLKEVKDSFNPINKWENQGALLYKTSMFDTNKPDATGFLFSLYDWNFGFEPKRINTNNSLGCEEFYNIGAEKKIENHMWDNYWTQKDMLTLPMNAEEYLGFGTSLTGGLIAASIGKWWQAATLGLIGVIGYSVEKYRNRAYKSFRGFVSKPLMDMNNKSYSSSSIGDEKILDFNILNNKQDSPSSVFFDSKTMTTSFECNLTDEFTTFDPSVEVKELNTTNIGQKFLEDGITKIRTDGKPYLVNGSESLVLPSNTIIDYGFIIDSWKIQGSFTGDYSVEFLDFNNNIVWSGIYESQGKWTGSHREIWTEKSTSIFGRENLFFSKPLPYPEPIVEVPDYIDNFNHVINHFLVMDKPIEDEFRTEYNPVGLIDGYTSLIKKTPNEPPKEQMIFTLTPEIPDLKSFVEKFSLVEIQYTETFNADVLVNYNAFLGAPAPSHNYMNLASIDKKQIIKFKDFEYRKADNSYSSSFLISTNPEDQNFGGWFTAQHQVNTNTPYRRDLNGPFFKSPKMNLTLKIVNDNEVVLRSELNILDKSWPTDAGSKDTETTSKLELYNNYIVLGEGLVLLLSGWIYFLENKREINYKIVK